MCLGRFLSCILPDHVPPVCGHDVSEPISCLCSRLLLLYGLQVVTREVHRSSLRRFRCGVVSKTEVCVKRLVLPLELARKLQP